MQKVVDEAGNVRELLWYVQSSEAGRRVIEDLGDVVEGKMLLCLFETEMLSGVNRCLPGDSEPSIDQLIGQFNEKVVVAATVQATSFGCC